MKPRHAARLLRWRAPRGLRRVHSTRLRRAAPSALHPATVTRLVGSTLLLIGLVTAFVPGAGAEARKDSTGTIVGWVRDSCSGAPILSADIIVPAVRLGTKTDRRGRFELRVPCGLTIVKVAAVYHTPRRDTLIVSCAHEDTLWVASMPGRILSSDGDVFLMTDRDSCP